MLCRSRRRLFFCLTSYFQLVIQVLWQMAHAPLQQPAQQQWQWACTAALNSFAR